MAQTRVIRIGGIGRDGAPAAVGHLQRRRRSTRAQQENTDCSKNVFMGVLLVEKGRSKVLRQADDEGATRPELRRSDADAGPITQFVDVIENIEHRQPAADLAKARAEIE